MQFYISKYKKVIRNDRQMRKWGVVFNLHNRINSVHVVVSSGQPISTQTCVFTINYTYNHLCFF